jgi:hypothetical protein
MIYNDEECCDVHGLPLPCEGCRDDEVDRQYDSRKAGD